jgi:hypothetical protein
MSPNQSSLHCIIIACMIFVATIGSSSTVAGFTVPATSTHHGIVSTATSGISTTSTSHPYLRTSSCRPSPSALTPLKDSSLPQDYDTTKSTIQNNLRALSSKYTKLTTDHYLLMAFLQAGVLASSADIATQSMEHAGPLDYTHVQAMAAVASTMSGATNAIWLKKLESKFPGTEFKEVAYKTLIHATIIATIINSAYLIFVPMFTTYGFTPAAFDINVMISDWSWDEFVTLMQLEVLMFIPYNTLAFKYISPSIRPLTHASVSATFNIAVSAVTLGYFDTWCERAMTVVKAGPLSFFLSFFLSTTPPPPPPSRQFLLVCLGREILRSQFFKYHFLLSDYR